MNTVYLVLILVLGIFSPRSFAGGENWEEALSSIELFGTSRGK